MWVSRIEKKIPITDTCNTRIWEKTYNVNLEGPKGGKKHLRHSEFTIYTDSSKKEEGTGGGFVVYHYNKIIHTQFPDARTCNSIPS